MKNSKINIKTAFFAVLFALASIFSACSENNPLSPSFSTETDPANLPPASITIEPTWIGNVLCFKLKNNSVDTIVNDFHVQFSKPVKIIGWSIMPGWQIDPATTDTAKGKIGVKAGPNGQSIPAGGVGIPLGVQIIELPNPRNDHRMWWDYTWQATRDGIVVREGKDVFPPR